jgi:hypothetical protein
MSLRMSPTFVSAARSSPAPINIDQVKSTWEEALMGMMLDTLDEVAPCALPPAALKEYQQVDEHGFKLEHGAYASMIGNQITYAVFTRVEDLQDRLTVYDRFGNKLAHGIADEGDVFVWY